MRQPYAVVKRWAESIGIEVTEFQTRNIVDENLEITVTGFGGFGKAEVRYRHNATSAEKAWLLLHEIGHCDQTRTGFLTYSRCSSAYGWAGTTEDTLRIERDAWRRAGLFAKKLGIPVTPPMRKLGRLLFSTYRVQS